MSHNIFIDKLEQNRIKLNLSQSEMAAKLNMSLSSYKRLINGEVSTRMLEIPIRFRELTGASLYGMDTHISRQHKIMSELQDMTDEELDFIESVITFIKR